MEYLFERYNLNKAEEILSVERVLARLELMMRNPIDNSSILFIANPENPNELLIGLDLLSHHKLLTYEKVQMKKTELLFHVWIENRYNIQLLERELKELRRKPERLLVERSPILPRVPHMVYYDLNTGEIIFNGKDNKLTKISKKLFDELFLAYPETAKRSKLYQALGMSKNDNSKKVALSEAMSALRSACGVNARCISLGSQGGTLKARAYPLSAQLTRKKI